MISQEFEISGLELLTVKFDLNQSLLQAYYLVQELPGPTYPLNTLKPQAPEDIWWDETSSIFHWQLPVQLSSTVL